MAEADILIEARDLRKRFEIRRSMFRGSAGFVNAVNGIDLTLREGETLGHHANNRIGDAVEIDSSAKHVRIRTEAVLPHRMGEHGHAEAPR